MILIKLPHSTNPYIHAAAEEFIVRNLLPGNEDKVMLYINSPCVVVGKNQCIYREVNHEYLREHKPVVRRISGGGTVYHDEGNLCFALLSKFDNNKLNNYPYFNQPIVDVLKQAGIDATFSSRNDILWQGKKISGNAQFTDRKNILSHGTILVNANLTNLRYALKENLFSVETKAVASVRSSVKNISDGGTIQTAEQLRELLLANLPISNTITFSDAEWQIIIEKAYTKFKSNEWTWGRNPHTIITKGDLIIEIENGIIIKSTKPEMIGKWFKGEFL